MTTRIASDGTRLAVYRWDAVGTARSTIVLVHGLAEHLGRYDHVGKALAARGHTVTGADLRGFGRSEGRRAHVRSWSEYLDDLDGVLADARAERRPVVLLGHSLGALVAASFVTGGYPAPDLMVLSAPPISDDLPAAKKLAARVLGVLAPRAEIANGLRGDQLSTDPTVGERYFADPLVHPSTTLRLGREALRAQARLRASLADLARVPMLVIHADEDRIVPVAASAPLADLPGATRVVFPGFRHESFNEDGGARAIAVVADWIESRL